MLQLYANKWRHSIAETCASLAQVLQVADAVPLQMAIEAAWPFADQVSYAAYCIDDGTGAIVCITGLLAAVMYYTLFALVGTTQN